MENYFQQTLPIYVFGDSHVLPLKNCIFKDELTDKWIVTKSKYISGLTAHDFYNIKNEEFHSEFINALEYEGLIRNNKACHLSYEEIDFNIFKASNQPVISPLIFLTMGDIDIRLIILPMFKDKFDFIPPFFNPYPKSNKPNLLWDMVADTMNTRIKPFIEGIKSLKTAGFNRIYVQLISPPTMDEENFHKRHGYECPFNIRYKVVYAFNKLLSEQCSVLGVNVIDVWPYVTDNDYLKPDLEFDGVHLPSHAALLNLNLLLKHAINHQWESVNYIRHELYYRMACNTNVFEKSENRTSKNKLQPGMNIPPRRCNDKAPKTDPQFNENWINEAIVSFQNDGICKLKIDLDKIKEWRNILPFDRDVGNLHSAWDWAGNSIVPYSNVIRTCIPPEQILMSLKQILDQTEYDLFFKSILGCSVTIINCRPVLSLPHQFEGLGPQSWHEDGCPAGIIRGVLYLSEVDEESGPFQFKKTDGTPVTVTGAIGDFLIFDAMRLSHRALPPKTNERVALDFVFAPRIAGASLNVVASGMNHWPADPFCFSIPTDNSNNLSMIRKDYQVFNDQSRMQSECDRLRSEILKMQNSKFFGLTMKIRKIYELFKYRFIGT